jgi:sulfate transport system ATP-binding protein
MDIHIRDVSKSFSGFPALRGVNLDIESGELIALLGPSGSGKTTLLRAIAGLENVDNGEILFGTENACRLPVQGRRVGFVFQHYALFKHMTVGENIAFGLRVRDRRHRPNDEAIRARVKELLDLIQLPGLEKRYPSQLSGGQKQRVALARALAIDPRVLLLDEPFGALDAKVRKDLRRWLRELHDRTGYTTVFVTHDQEEALELADRIVVMNRGQIEQVGNTDALYEHPASPFVFDFLGDTNVLPGEVRGRHVFVDGDDRPIVTDSIQPAGPVDVYVRPDDLRVVESDDAGFEAVVRSVQRTGPLVRLSAQLAKGGVRIEFELPHPDPEIKVWERGERIRLRPARFSIFPRNGKPRSGETPKPSGKEQRERVRN